MKIIWLTKIISTEQTKLDDIGGQNVHEVVKTPI